MYHHRILITVFFITLLQCQGIETSISLSELTVLKEGGKTEALGSFKGDDEILVLVFAASTCPITSCYWKRLKGTWYSYREKKVKMVILGGNSDDKYETLHQELEKQDLDLPLVWDIKHTIAKYLGLEFTPEVAVIGQDWSVLYRGKIDNFWRDEQFVQERYLDKAITDALDGKKSTNHIDDAFIGSRMR
jgi:peroxiredoxin